MFCRDGKHLPQIEYYYDGYVYPFIGKADLKTLIEWRTEKISSGAFWSYNKDARNTFSEHLLCIEQCCRILLSNPTPESAINELAKQQEQSKLEDQKAKERSDKFWSEIVAQDRDELLKNADKFSK